MPLIDVKQEGRLFGEKLRAGHYETERSKNSEVNYAEKKESRDMCAVKEFLRQL